MDKQNGMEDGKGSGAIQIILIIINCSTSLEEVMNGGILLNDLRWPFPRKLYCS